MTTLLLVLTPIALLDATSITPLCIVPLIMLMSGPHGIRLATVFLAGIFVAYVGCSLVVLLGLQTVIDRAGAWFVHWWNHPDTLDILIGMAIGATMVLFGARLATAREKRQESRLGGSISPAQVFGAGAGLTIVGLPGALPLFAAVDQILRADPGWIGGLMAVLFYNIVFVAPLASLVVARAIIGESIEPTMRRLDAWMSRWSHRALVVGLVAGGLLFVADGIGWLLGHPLLPTFPEPAALEATPS